MIVVVLPVETSGIYPVQNIVIIGKARAVSRLIVLGAACVTIIWQSFIMSWNRDARA